MWSALARHASRHALFYVIALGLGAQAFGTSFYDNFYPIPPGNMAELGWWQIAALLLKSGSFAIGIVVGYLIKSPDSKAEANGTAHDTTPPIPTK